MTICMSRRGGGKIVKLGGKEGEYLSANTTDSPSPGVKVCGEVPAGCDLM